MSDSTTDVPLPLAAVEPIVAGHADRFAEVLQQAWASMGAMRSACPEEMSGAGSSTRGMLVSDFTVEPAHRIFDGIDGVRVDERYRRPWVCLAGDTVQVRFRKLTPALQICVSTSERATKLAFHLGDPLIPDIPEATVLTAGYVVDAAGLSLERLALVCHIGSRLHYAIDLPGGAATQPAPTQLPLTPLPAPIIRSARDAATQRLADRASDDG